MYVPLLKRASASVDYRVGQICQNFFILVTKNKNLQILFRTTRNLRCSLSFLEHLQSALEGLVDVINVGGVALEGKVHQRRVQRNDIVQWHFATTLRKERGRNL